MCATWTFLICILFLWFAEVLWILTDSEKSEEQPFTNTLLWTLQFCLLWKLFNRSHNILPPDVGDVYWDSVTSVDDWDTFCLGTKTDRGLSLSLHFSLYKRRRQQLLPQYFFVGGGETPRKHHILMSAVEFSRMAPEYSSSQIEKYLWLTTWKLNMGPVNMDPWPSDFLRTDLLRAMFDKSTQLWKPFSKSITPLR